MINRRYFKCLAIQNMITLYALRNEFNQKAKNCVTDMT